MSIHHDSDTSIIKALRAGGYKATPQRIAISRFALHSRNHPTAKRIYSEVKKVYPTVSLATIYKTIKILEEVGLIQELNLPKEQTRFDPNMEPHAHLICLHCRRINDWINPLISELIERASIEAGFATGGQSFDIFGVCGNCNRNAKL